MENQTHKLPASLDIKATSPLVDELLKLRGSDLLIDAAEVKNVGSQCLQILLSAKKTWEADGYYYAITRPSQAFCDGLEHLGFSSDCFGVQIANKPEDTSL